MRRILYEGHQTPLLALRAARLHGAFRLFRDHRAAGHGSEHLQHRLDGNRAGRDKAQQYVDPRYARQLHAVCGYALHFSMSGRERCHAADLRLPLSGHASGARTEARPADAGAQAQHRALQDLQLPVCRNAHTR